MVKDKRSYHVFFNLHTVSGIAITIGLFVIFLAGAFALFAPNINRWQYNERKHPLRVMIDYDRILERVKQEGYEIKGRRNFFVGYRRVGDYIKVSAPALKDANDSIPTSDKTIGAGNRESISMSLAPESYSLLAEEPAAQKELLGNYIYRLHFFDQIPGLGLYISGFLALFFGLSVISGIIVHWKKMVPNFFTFRLKSSIKNLWADAHTALGVLGLPFQFMYAITGAFFGVVALFYIPVFLIQYGGDAKKFQEALNLNPSIEMESFPAPTQRADSISINALVHPELEALDARQISSIGVVISDYQKKQGNLTLEVSYKEESQFMTASKKVIRLADGLVLQDKTKDDYGYTDVTKVAMLKLHYASFGGLFVKIIYFILSLITCYVILSGVMIWLVAREKKTYAPKAKFNRNVGAIFIGACMGLYPAIALFFCLVKLFPGSFGITANAFFLFWLAYTVYSYFIKSTFTINKHALIIAGGLGLLIPVFNGIQSELWFWKSLGMGYSDSFLVDVSWILMSAFSLWAAFIAKPVERKMKSEKTIEKKGSKDHKEGLEITDPVFNLNSSARK